MFGSWCQCAPHASNTWFRRSTRVCPHKWHLSRFISFCRAHWCTQQTTLLHDLCNSPQSTPCMRYELETPANISRVVGELSGNGSWIAPPTVKRTDAVSVRPAAAGMRSRWRGTPGWRRRTSLVINCRQFRRSRVWACWRCDFPSRVISLCRSAVCAVSD